MDRSDWGFLAAIVIMITVLIAVVIGVPYMFVGITVGQEYETVGRIRLYEHSSWIRPHTSVVFETFGGTTTEITLLGYHDFELGTTYIIHTICRRGGMWGTTNWYEVVSITKVL
jgi:hypothetical protein